LNPRLDYGKVCPEVREAMLGLEKYAGSSGEPVRLARSLDEVTHRLLFVG
jgi:hypothetical protein